MISIVITSEEDDPDSFSKQTKIKNKKINNDIELEAVVEREDVVSEEVSAAKEALNVEYEILDNEFSNDKETVDEVEFEASQVEKEVAYEASSVDQNSGYSESSDNEGYYELEGVEETYLKFDNGVKIKPEGFVPLTVVADGYSFDIVQPIESMDGAQIIVEAATAFLGADSCDYSVDSSKRQIDIYTAKSANGDQ